MQLTVLVRFSRFASNSCRRSFFDGLLYNAILALGSNNTNPSQTNTIPTQAEKQAKKVFINAHSFRMPLLYHLNYHIIQLDVGLPKILPKSGQIVSRKHHLSPLIAVNDLDELFSLSCRTFQYLCSGVFLWLW